MRTGGRVAAAALVLCGSAGSPRAFGADPARMISTRLWRVLIILLAAGCAGGPVVVVGEGGESFAELAEGDVLTMHAGPQGGYHVLAGIRCRNLGPVVLLEVDVTDAATGEPLTVTGLELEGRLSPAGEWDELVPIVAPMRVDAAELDGREVVLSARVSDAAGAVAEDGVGARLVLAGAR